jgi:hypothetical protein
MATPHSVQAVDRAYDNEKFQPTIRCSRAYRASPSRTNLTEKTSSPIRIRQKHPEIGNSASVITRWRRTAARFDHQVRDFLVAAQIIAVVFWIRL